MKTIIAGTRTINNYFTVVNAIIDSGWWHEISEVVCGDCKGVDEMGEIWGKSRSLPIRHFPADWETFGKAAGPIRNEAMAQYADALLLVWDGTSRGSASMLRLAERHGLKIHKVVATKEAA